MKFPRFRKGRIKRKTKKETAKLNEKSKKKTNRLRKNDGKNQTLRLDAGTFPRFNGYQAK